MLAETVRHREERGCCDSSAPAVGARRRATAPDRTDRVDHVTCLQPVAAGDLGFTRRAAAQGAAFGEKFGPGSAVDRAIDATAAQQAFVGGVA